MISTKQFTVFEVKGKIKYSNKNSYWDKLFCFNTTKELFAENKTESKEVSIADIFKMV